MPVLLATEGLRPPLRSMDRMELPKTAPAIFTSLKSAATACVVLTPRPRRSPRLREMGFADFQAITAPPPALSSMHRWGWLWIPKAIYIFAISPTTGIRKVAANGTSLPRFAGDGAHRLHVGDGNGLATAANVRTPGIIAADPITSNGNISGIVFSQLNASAIRRIDLNTNIITTLCGNGTNSFGGDNGPATAARVNGHNLRGCALSMRRAICASGRFDQRAYPQKSRAPAASSPRSACNVGNSGFAGDKRPPAVAALFQLAVGGSIGVEVRF